MFSVRNVIMWSLIAVAVCTGLNAQQTEGEFYFVGDERVPLQASPNYRAFKLDTEPGRIGEFARSLPNEIAVQQPSVLDRYNIILFRRTGPASAPSIIRSLETTRDSLDGVSGAVSEAPVYWSGGADHILVNEFVVQFLEIPRPTRSSV